MGTRVGKTTWFARAAGALAAFGVVAVFAMPAGAQDPAPTSSARCAKSLEPGEAHRTHKEVTASAAPTSLNPIDEPAPYDFEQGRGYKRRSFTFLADQPIPSAPATDGYQVTVDLYRDGEPVDREAVEYGTSSSGSRFIVDVCVDAQHLSPGSYTGHVIVDDDRLPPASDTYTVSLQYEVVGNLHWWGLYALLMLAVAMMASYVVYLASLRKGGSGRTGPGLVPFVRQNTVALAFGFVALLSVLIANVWRDQSWAGTGTDWINLTIIVVPAMVGAMSARVLYDDVTSAVVPEVAAAEVAAADAPAVAPKGRRSRTRLTAGPAPSAPAPRGTSTPQWLPALIGAVTAIVLFLGAAGALQAINGDGTADETASPTVPVEVTTSTSIGSATTTGGTPGTLTATPTTVASASVTIPDVYGQEADAGVQALTNAGLVPFVYRVCSGSVPAEHIRQVLLRDGPVVVGAPNEHVKPRDVAPGTLLDVKISTGKACS